jgi:hypothetical protein
MFIATVSQYASRKLFHLFNGELLHVPNSIFAELHQGGFSQSLLRPLRDFWLNETLATKPVSMQI